MNKHAKKSFLDSHDMRLSNILTKRGLENLHVVLWTLKDLSWIRVWDYRIILIIGISCLALSFYTLFHDTLALFSPEISDPSFRYVAYKELPATIAQVFWLFGNVWWAVGENYDLRFNACFCEVYVRSRNNSSYSIVTALIFEGILWVVVVGITIFPTKEYYMGMFDDFVKFRYLLSMRKDGVQVCAGSPDLAGEALKFSPLNAHADRQFLHSDDMVDEIMTEHNSMSSSSDVDENAKELYTRTDIQGMPRVLCGPIRIPAGTRDYRTGIVSEKPRWTWSNRFMSYRDFELLILLFWIGKDVAWLVETGPALIWLGVASCCIVTLAAACCYMCFRYCEGFLERCHAFCLLLWVLSNIVWAVGEVYFGVPELDLPTLPADQFNIFIPPYFTPLDELPGASWTFRWVAGWMMLVNVLVLASTYCTIVFASIRRAFLNRRDAAAGSVINQAVTVTSSTMSSSDVESI